MTMNAAAPSTVMTPPPIRNKPQTTQPRGQGPPRRKRVIRSQNRQRAIMIVGRAGAASSRKWDHWGRQAPLRGQQRRQVRAIRRLLPVGSVVLVMMEVVVVIVGEGEGVGVAPRLVLLHPTGSTGRELEAEAVPPG